MKLKQLLVVMVLATGLLAGCGHRQDDWHKAQQQNTITAYQSFIKKYPNSDQAKQARQQIAQIKVQKQRQAEQQAWQQAQQANTRKAYKQFLQNFSKGPHAAQARQKMQSLRRQGWAKARSADNVQALQNYISKYPRSPQAQQARAEIQRLQAQQRQQKQQQKQAQQSNRTGQPSTQNAPQQPSTAQGKYQVQLGAFHSKSVADSAQQTLQKQFSNLFDNTTITVEKPTGSSSYYKLKTQPMSQSDAKSLCNALQKQKHSCYVTERSTS